MTGRDLSLAEGVAPPQGARWRRVLAGVYRGERPLFAFFQSITTQVLIIAVNILTGVLTARFLGPYGRGLYTAVTTWPQLFATLATSGLTSAVIVRLRKQPDRASGVAAAALLVAGVSLLLMSAVAMLLVPSLMSKYSAADIALAQLCLVGVIVNGIHMTLKQTLAGMGRFKEYNKANLRPQLYYLVILAVIIAFATLDAHLAAIALLAAGVAALIVILPSVVAIARPRLFAGIQELRYLVSYSTRAAPMDIVYTLATYADRLVLIPLLPVGDLGFYAVAFSFSRVIQLVQPAIMSVVLSHLSGHTDEGGKRLHDRASRLLIACLIPGCALLWLIGKPLLGYAYGGEFRAAAPIFRVLVIEASLGLLSQMTAQLFLSRNRPGVVSMIQLAVLCASGTAILLLVPKYGALGAALGLLAAGLLRWFLLWNAVKLILKMPLPRLYPDREDFRYVLARF